RFVKPLDEALVCEIAASHGALVTLEENVVMGGAGSAVVECLLAANAPCPVLQLGLPDVNLEHGSREQLLARAGLDVESIGAKILAFKERVESNPLAHEALRERV
ncbi:MAG: transketolase C-terminal domain-containing protein, partial [Pseudomonadota bacterium]